MERIIVAALSAAIILLGTGAASAGPVPSDVLTVYQPGTGPGCAIPPTPPATHCINDQSFLFETDESSGPGIVTNTDPWDPTSTPIVLLEPDGSISDVLYVAAPFDLVICSDSDQAGAPSCFLPPNAVFLPETSDPVNVTSLFYAGLADSGFSATFQSDVETSVPEPITLALFGTGLAGIVTMCRRRKSRAPAI